MGLMLRLPLIVILAGVGALAMVVPGLYAHAMDQHKIGSIFLGCAGLFLLLAAITGLVTADEPDGPRPGGADHAGHDGGVAGDAGRALCAVADRYRLSERVVGNGVLPDHDRRLALFGRAFGRALASVARHRGLAWRAFHAGGGGGAACAALRVGF